VIAVLALAGAAGGAAAQEHAGPAALQVRSAAAPINGWCGEWVKFTVSMVDEQDSARIETVTFWEGPITGTNVLERARLRVQSVAQLGAWGTGVVGGYHNGAYVREFYPGGRILRTRFEYDCRR
jgi:hypothetical protein